MLTEAGASESNFNFFGVLVKIASIRAKDNIQGGSILNRTNLISSLCARYRDSFPAIYKPKQVLPKEIHNKIGEAVDSYINAQLTQIHSKNAQRIVQTRVLDNRTGQVTLETKSIGSDSVKPETAVTTIEVKIEQAETRLQKLMEKLEPDYDAENKCKLLIDKLYGFRSAILKEIESQKEAKSIIEKEFALKEALEIKAKYPVL